MSVTKPKSAAETSEFFKRAYKSRDKMYDKIMMHPTLSRAGMKVGYYLLKQYIRSTKGFAWPSIDTMVRVLGLSQPTVSKAIRSLESLGFFKVRRSDQPHRGTSNEYIPQFEAGDEASPVTPKRTQEGVNSVPKEGVTAVIPSRVLKREGKPSFQDSTKKAHKPASRGSARRALWAVLEVPEEIQTELKTKTKICDWTSFYKEVSYHNYDSYCLRSMFFPNEMSLDAYDRSLTRFSDLVVKKSPWRNVTEACQRLILWLSEEKKRGGLDYGEPCLD